MGDKALKVFCVLSLLLILSICVNVYQAVTKTSKQPEGEYTYEELANMYNDLADDYEKESQAKVNAESNLTKTTSLYNKLATDYNKAQDEIKTLKEAATEEENSELIEIEVPDIPNDCIGWIYIPTCDVSAYMHYGSTMQAISNKFVGEFEDTGKIGVGNYCVLGHSNEKKKYVFSSLKPNIKIGDPIYVYKDGTIYKFNVGYTRVVDPDNVWILTDTETDQATITIMCCADEGKKRFAVFGNFVASKELSIN